VTRGQRSALTVMLIATAFGLGLQTGCVTRTQVCVSAEHARAASDDWRRANTAGASVCVDVEKP
jgi:hypothetical protein